MASNSDKNWNRSWTLEEIIKNSENWSLAGDVALLNTIKSFADNMLNKTVALSDNVDDLLNNLNEVSLKLDISQNEFHSLRNSQFIESRVYEDDETLGIREDIKVEEKEPSEEEKVKLIRESVLEGLAVVDKYFDKIEVAISDSEEETDKSYVLQAKDLYANRPLPLIIGSDEWYKKWHVGLAESSSESGTDNVSETYSVSDSEDELPKDMLKASETSSELDFSNQANVNRPVANSTFNDSVKKPDIFASDEENDEPGSLPVKTPISNKSFAEQLAAKLGDVINEREVTPVEVNKKPIQPVSSNKFVGELFSDEPPPLDELDDTILPKSTQSDLFSGGQGLFDDTEDESFWGEQNKSSNIKSEEDKSFKVSDKSETQNTAQTTKILPKSSKVSKGLFDSDDSSDEDIFAANKKQFSKQPFLQSYKTHAPLFDVEPPELDIERKTIEEGTKKKSGFGPDLFADGSGEDMLKDRRDGNNVSTMKNEELTKQNVLSSANDEKNVRKTEEKPKTISFFDDEIDYKVVTPSRIVETTNKSKKISLFDDDDDLFKDDLFSEITSSKLTSNLFEDEKQMKDLFKTNIKNNNTPKVDLFVDVDNAKDKTEAIPDKNKVEVKPEEKSSERPRKNITLFSDNNEEEEEEDVIFNQKSEVPNNKLSTTDVANNNTKQNDSKPGYVDKNVSKTNESVRQRQVIGAEKKIPRGLFDDDDNENEADDLFKDVGIKTENKSDLFGNSVVADYDKNTASFVPKLEAESETEPPEFHVPQKNVVSLFGTSPPPDDDDWDTKSDNFSDNEDQFAYPIDGNSGGFSLFDNEPPSLEPNESSGIVSDYNARSRIVSDDSSFYPYASSSRRLSSDIYNEQQSQDSFFVTKNKMESINVTSQLDIIQEDTKSSYVNITPSGNLEDFVESKEYVFTANPSSVLEENRPLHADDLFSASNPSGNVPKLSERRVSLFDNVDNALEVRSKELQESPFVQKGDRSKPDVLEAKREDNSGVGGIEPPSQGKVRHQIASITEQLQNESVEEVPKAPGGLPGKLKHNLNINVNALMPGVVPPKLRDMSKSQSLDLPKEEEAISTTSSNPDVSHSTLDLPGQMKVELGISSEKATSFGDALDSVEVLHSVTKDRAKIPIKRRPSTRRGRQQAIRKSEAEISLEKDNDFNRKQLKSVKVEKLEPESTKPDLDKSWQKTLASSVGPEKTASPTISAGNLTSSTVIPEKPTSSTVSTEKPTSSTVSTKKSSSSIVSTEKLPTSTVSTEKPTSSTVSTEKPPSSTVSTEKSTSSTVSTKKSTSSTVSTEKSSSSIVSTEKLPSSTVSTEKPTSSTVSTGETRAKNIFDDEDYDIFPSLPGTAKKWDNTKSSIFDSADSDGDLFGDSMLKKSRPEGKNKSKSDNVANMSKKSLFNDSSSDDELFLISGSGKKKEPLPKPVEKKKQRILIIRKLENIEPDDDPLSSLLK